MIIQVQFGFNQIDNFFKKNCHLRFPINVKKKKKKKKKNPTGSYIQFVLWWWPS
jgi:hypothetical protein